MVIGEYTEEQVLSLAQKTYSEGKASFQIVPYRCALLVVSMQDVYVRPHWTPFWVPDATRQVGKIKTLITRCREKNIPIIYTRFNKTHKYLDRPHCGQYMANRSAHVGMRLEELSQEDRGRIWHEITPHEDDIVLNTTTYGAFYDTPLETILKNLEKDTVIICGALSNINSGTTARQAYERSFKVVFGSDVNSTNNPELHEAELKVLRSAFALVLSLKEILAAIDY